MKTKILVLTLVIAALGAPCFAGAVRFTGDLTADFPSGASAQQIISAFANGSQPLLGGFGWEVVPGRLGFGGDYEVRFSKNVDSTSSADAMRSSASSPADWGRL